MTQLSRKVKVIWAVLMVLALGFIISCSSNDDDPTPAPIASFQYVANEANGLEITFTNYSKDASSYAWNFGDGAGTSTEANVTYAYAEGGIYTVTLTATNETGTSDHTKEITVVNTLLPAANFQFQVSSGNPLEVTFSDLSVNADSYAWDFGDNAGASTEANPTYTYAAGGTYTVVLTTTNSYGSADISKDVTVVSPDAVNMIANGGFDDESVWTIIQQNPNNNATITIADGVAFYDDVVQGSWGSEGHVGMNQAVTVESGNYQLDLDITTNGINEFWFEVWVGLGAPVEFEDYNDNNNASPVLAFNTWRCADNATYSGPMTAASCPDPDNGLNMDGSITLEAGTYYVVIRGGGITWGDGITIDNVSMYKVD